MRAKQLEFTQTKKVKQGAHIENGKHGCECKQ
jgi:hypothetical protein